jgi:hypothetical protein
MDSDALKALAKTKISQTAKNLSANDVKFLVETLAEKDDKLRYNAFLLLQENSHQSQLVYLYWDKLEQKLESDNSYQRSIGLMLIAANVQWDKEGKFGKTISKYLNCCLDEKFITARQATQGLAEIIKATEEYNEKIKQKLEGISLTKYPENQQRLLTKDVANILKLIKQTKNTKQP